MTFSTLTLICLIALAGPLLTLPGSLHLPVVLGEIAMGIAFGQTGTDTLHASDGTFSFLADLGFALVMFVAGSHVPVRDPRLKSALLIGALRAAGVGAVAVSIAAVLSHVFATDHLALYAVLMASSSAALILPIVDSLHLSGAGILQLLPQVALADTVCIVALPLAIDPRHAVRAGLGATAVVSTAALLFVVLRLLERNGARKRLHRFSEKNKLALELRISLMILAALAAVAVRTHVSIMLAGFSFGLAVAAIGEPRRLARQLFALTEGFLGPLFFVWLGASLNLRELTHHASYVVLGILLAAGAVVSHIAMRLARQPIALGALASAQLGVPVAAVTVGGQLHVLKPGEAASLVLAALISVAIASFAGAAAAKNIATPSTPAGTAAASPPA